MGLKLEINPASGPVLIRTLPFNVEPSRTGLESHQIVARQTFSNQRYNGGQPQVQISPPRPGSYDNYRGRPNNVQISPPRPGSYNNFQGRPNNVQISPPRPGSYDNLQTRPIIQISPPRPGPYNNNAQTRPRFNWAHLFDRINTNAALWYFCNIYLFFLIFFFPFFYKFKIGSTQEVIEFWFRLSTRLSGWT